MIRSALGHLRTIAKRIARAASPPAVPPSESWSTTLEDPEVGPVRLTGELARAPDGARGSRFLIAVHGLGGCADSPYMRLIAQAAVRTGWTVLRLNLRGADRLGEDFYHAGLIEDLEAAVAAVPPEFEGRVAVTGFSLGGHVALRYAARRPSERVAAVAAVCPPLDLAAGADHLDGPGPLRALYRRYLLGHLREIYAAVAYRRPVPLPLADADAIRTLREWDDRTVAPRHGFAGAAEYYEQASVAPHLEGLQRPALAVPSRDDPMVPASVVRPWLDRPYPALDVRWRNGGHVAFARRLDLGEEAAPGIEAQVLAWLAARLPA